MTPEDAAIAEALMCLAHERGVERSFCPSEVARTVAPDDWRGLMPQVRRVASTLPRLATQKGQPVDPLTARGPIRLRRAE